jgi:hypothetical protein
MPPNSRKTRVRLDCLLCADCVAKVGAPLQARNYRIQRTRRLNQSCAVDRFAESILRVGMRKIFLQQYLPFATIAPQQMASLFDHLVGAAEQKIGFHRACTFDADGAVRLQPKTLVKVPMGMKQMQHYPNRQVP